MALIFIHILTYLEEELAWRHWGRLLRATTTWAIFTVSLYKKILIKTSLHSGTLVAKGPIIPRINPCYFSRGLTSHSLICPLNDVRIVLMHYAYS